MDPFPEENVHSDEDYSAVHWDLSQDRSWEKQEHCNSHGCCSRCCWTALLFCSQAQCVTPGAKQGPQLQVKVTLCLSFPSDLPPLPQLQVKLTLCLPFPSDLPPLPCMLISQREISVCQILRYLVRCQPQNKCFSITALLNRKILNINEAQLLFCFILSSSSFNVALFPVITYHRVLFSMYLNAYIWA